MPKPPIPSADLHHISSAVGWRELGNLTEALAELDRVSPENRSHPDVLELRWSLQAERGDWAAALAVATQLVQIAAGRAVGFLHQAYAARRAPGGSVQAAWQILRPAADRFPKDRLIPYNLACYLCQMQRLDEARDWLKRAFALGDKTKRKRMALQDADLQALWPEIGGM
jgi:tetratricopeptide (TPR) repeat protein